MFECMIAHNHSFSLDVKDGHSTCTRKVDCWELRIDRMRIDRHGGFRDFGSKSPHVLIEEIMFN
jgi:hypothetical protein